MSGFNFWAELDRHMFGVAVELDDCEPELAPKAGHNRPPDAKAEDLAHFHFRGNILDRLGEHMRLARLVRKVSSELYAHCGVIGAVLAPPLTVDEGVTARWRAAAPMSFGAVSFTPTTALRYERSDDDLIPASFGVFRYIEEPGCFIEPTTDKVYEVAWIYYDTKRDGDEDKRPICVHFICGVSPGGDVRVLREMYEITNTIRHRDGTMSSVPAGRRMKISERLIHLAEEKNQTVDRLATTMFWMLTNIIEQSHGGGFRVSVTDRHGTRATFIIDMLRTPYFFADRDVTIGETGKRKKIFHIVRTHKRQLPGGGETFVRSHFRGERRFRWGGYKVVVGLDGAHNPAPLDYRAGGIMHDEDEVPKGMMTTEGAAKLIARAMTSTRYQDRQRRNVWRGA